jgi:WD40 repeat protein
VGAYGEVWLARNVLGAYRAVKVVYRASFREERAYEREFRGIQNYEPISRTNDGLVDVLQAGRNDAAGYYYHVMELADDAAGESEQVGRWESEKPAGSPAHFPTFSPASYLPRTLHSEMKLRGRLPPAECVQLGLQLTLALGHLHRHGLIHRDIKPSNIIFVQGIPKLADIGLVTPFDDTASFVGTEGFVPPEGPTSPRADLFSLGKVLYEISTGKDRKDFPEPPTGLGEDGDGEGLEELNAIILRACAFDPAERYQTAEELHADLALLNSGKSVKWKRVVERRLAFARKAGAVVGLIAALATCGYLYQRHQTREAKRLQQLAEDLLARRDIQIAENLFARGDSALALAHLAQVLRRHPDNRSAAERIMATLTQRNFPQLVTPPLRHAARLSLPAHRSAARLSPDGERIVTASEDRTVRLWDVRTGEERIPPYQHGGPVRSVEFSPDGRAILSASGDGTACLLDARTSGLILPPFKHGGPVAEATFDPSGQLVATAAADATARIFSVETGQMLHSLAHGDNVHSLALSRDGQRLATASEDESVRVWNVSSGDLEHSFKARGAARLVRFSFDGRWLAATVQNSESGGWEVQCWDARSGRALANRLLHQNRLYTLEFSPDSRRLVTATANNTARVWQVETGEPLFDLPHAAMVYCAKFSPDGQQLLTASVDHTARVWDAATGTPISEPLRHDGRVIHAEFSLDGERILTAGWEDKTVKLWTVRRRQREGRTLQHHSRVASAELDARGEEAICATGSAVFTANNINQWDIGSRNGVSVWDLATGTRKFPPVLPEEAEALTAQFTAAGPKALVAAREPQAFASQARIWNVPQGAFVGQAIQHEGGITCAYFSQDGLKLATGSTDGTARIWDAGLGVPLTPPLLHKGRINSIRFSPDARSLITASEDGTAMIWDAATGARICEPLSHDAAVWFAQFSPTGDKVVTVSLDYTAAIWRTNGARVSVLHHSAAVEYAEVSPDGTKAATASGDRTARLWNVATGQQLTEPLQHAELVFTARFSPDGLRVITASMDGTAQVWDAATGLKLADPFRHDGWVVSARFSADGQRAITASVDRTARIWEVPVARAPIPGWLPELAEAVAGQRLNPNRVPETVTWEEYADLKARLGKLPRTDTYVQWAQRMFADSTLTEARATASVEAPTPFP